MPEYDLNQVECILFEPEGNVRRLMRDALGHLRINRVQTFGHMEDVRKAFETGSPDLLVADATGTDSETFKVVHAIRHSLLGANPFLAIVVTAFNPTKSLLARVTNCGADALLVKPLAPKQLHERITALVESPRNFVVTSDFIGPDRRKSPRESSQIPLIEVPNTLRLKATNAFGRTNPHELIERASADVNEQKLLRQAFQAAFLIEFATPGLSAMPVERIAVEHLTRVVPVLDDLIHRLPAHATGSRSTAADQARALIAAVEVAHAQTLSGMVPPGLDRLKSSALEIISTLSPERPSDAPGREVAAAAAMYRSRLNEMAEAKAAEGARGFAPGGLARTGSFL
ncbi:response regulator [Skermanella pratensis]|uniref:response regulator n=1 Tax=Skermanella pratensis TaxID=2233999 RepID=UPI0013016175|nr:response regulator [Skermanella pratensis]